MEACAKDHVPKPPSKDFKYTHQVHIQERRRKRQTGDSEEEACVVETDTTFCTVSKEHRDIVVSSSARDFIKEREIPEISV